MIATGLRSDCCAHPEVLLPNKGSHKGYNFQFLVNSMCGCGGYKEYS